MSLPIETCTGMFGIRSAAEMREWIIRKCGEIRAQPGGITLAVDPATIRPYSDVSPDRPTRALISEGRWSADCPNGDGRSFSVHPGFPIMMCIYCGNVDIGGAWRTVMFPDFRERLEQLLSQRDRRDHQNWIGEPLVIVEAECELGRNI